MKNVKLANKEGKTKKVNVRFSLAYLIFGPLYYLYKVMIVRGILLSLVYVLVIYKGLFPLIKTGLINIGINADYLTFIDKIGEIYWWLIGALVALHILLAFITPRAVIRKLLKNGYVPFSEIDTQILIKHNLVKVGTMSYLSSFKPIDGVKGKIKMENNKELDKELNELKELLKDGMITKDEYEKKRAMAIMNAKE